MDDLFLNEAFFNKSSGQNERHQFDKPRAASTPRVADQVPDFFGLVVDTSFVKVV